MTLRNVMIHIKSVLNKDKNHFYYKILLEKYSKKLAKKYSQILVHSIIMGRFGEKEIAKEKFYAAKRPINICDVNVDNIIISKLFKTNSNSKYF